MFKGKCVIAAICLSAISLLLFFIPEVFSLNCRSLLKGLSGLSIYAILIPAFIKANKYQKIITGFFISLPILMLIYIIFFWHG
jgi:hypothetical protein